MLSRRLQSAAARPRRSPERQASRPGRDQGDLHGVDREVLQHRDFEQMSQAEIDEALRAIARLRLPCRSGGRDATGQRAADRVDFPCLAAPGAAAGGLTDLRRREPRRQPPPLVILCDISGSMALHAHVPAFHA